MKNSIKQSFIGGMAGTAVMTAVMMMAPMMGMPEMNPPAMLAGMMGLALAVGWMMHFMIGVMFALAYALLLEKPLRRLGNNLLKGAAFGVIAFVFAQIAMGMMSLVMGPMPAPEGGMMLMMLGSIMGHVIFGMVVAMFVKE
ncbi:MAG: hypothetical protein K9J06_00405 [Flavobacteriales bacterium]|nr:hypothetical protein [Flavobacteriales bacterium]